jgi:hyperosmotically inducible periplasmic protein
MKATIAFASLIFGLSAAYLPAHAAGDKAAPATERVGVIDDVVITNRIRADIAKDKTVSVFDIGVESKKGVVTLTGKVNTEAEAGRALEIAKRTENVVRVENQITVTPVGATK